MDYKTFRKESRKSINHDVLKNLHGQPAGVIAGRLDKNHKALDDLLDEIEYPKRSILLSAIGWKADTRIFYKIFQRLHGVIVEFENIADAVNGKEKIKFIRDSQFYDAVFLFEKFKEHGYINFPDDENTIILNAFDFKSVTDEKKIKSALTKARNKYQKRKADYIHLTYRVKYDYLSELTGL